MGLISDIKTAAQANGTKIQNTAEQDIETLFNKLYYAPKNQIEEVKFVKQMFTRGGASQERSGLHTSAIIVSKEQFCVREQVLSLLYKQEQKNNIPIGLLRIFEEGNAIHEKWQRLFIRGGLGKAEDMDFTRFYDEYNISYTPDAILTINGYEYVVEIKSVNTYQFQKMTSHPSATKQIQMYMRFTGIKRGIVLCDDKNTQAFKVFAQKYNKEITNDYIERLEDVKYHYETVMETNKMADRCDSCKTYMCKRAMQCPMRDPCYNRGKGRERVT